MLRRQTLWVPTVQHNPAFVEHVHKFSHNNPVTSLSVSAMGIKPEDSYVALAPDARNPQKSVALMMAFPLTISAAACNDAHAFTNSNSSNNSDIGSAVGSAPRELAFGFATAVSDSCNSFHVMERLLPHHNAHVSVNIQSQCLRPLREGDSAVLISTIDKMGKRLVYCKAAYLVEPSEPVSAAVVQRERQLKTMEELYAALARYEKVFASTHVKSILPEGRGRQA